MQVEAAKSSDLDALTRRQAIAHQVYQATYCQLDISSRQVLLLLRQDFNQVGPGHRRHCFFRRNSIHVPELVYFCLI